MTRYHTSVLLQEAVTALQIEKGKKYIDATLGGGGHTFTIAGQGGIVLSLDQDSDAIQFVQNELNETHPELRDSITIIQDNFANIGQVARSNGFAKVSGILFDIGVSAYQLEAGERGFSLQREGPLDMRMNPSQGVPAADLVNGLHKNELVDLFTKYGEEPFAKRIADAIVKARLAVPIQTTKQLADLIAGSVPKIGKVHPATKVFQALRIAVNDELHSLETGLQEGLDLLEAKGRMVVISFHSLEDRIVKNTFLEFAEKGLGTVITQKPITPLEKEIVENSRSRSAKMRVFEKSTGGK